MCPWIVSEFFATGLVLLNGRVARSLPKTCLAGDEATDASGSTDNEHPAGSKRSASATEMGRRVAWVVVFVSIVTAPCVACQTVNALVTPLRRLGRATASAPSCDPPNI